jgi:peptidase M3-like protein
MRPALALAFLLLVAGCKSGPETKPQLGRNATNPRSRVDESAAYVQALREEYDALTHVQAVLGWYAATQGETPIRKLTYIGHDRLFRRTALDALAAAERQKGVDGNDALALRFLRRALTGEIVTLATAGFTDELREAQASATVSLPWRDKPVAYNDLQNLIAQESDAQRRAQAFAAMNAVRVQKLNPILEHKEAAAQKAARETGFKDYVALSEELRSVKLDPLLSAGVAYVKATDALFRQTLDRVAREELDTPREKLRVPDLGRLWKAPRLAAFFDKQLELKALQAFLSGIGLDLRTAKGTEVHVDDSLNPKKVPRAFVEPVDAPADVRLSVKPSGGLDDYETLFHEAGHAVHFANATAAPRELVTQGYGAPTEAFGEFFRQAFSDPHWLLRYRAFLEAQGRRSPSNAELAAIQRDLALREMMFLRRYAFAKIAYELRLHGRPAEEIAPALALLPAPDPARESLRELYRQLFSVAYAFALDEDESQLYLTDVDDTFYSADYARAFVLAGMMHEGIRRRFGEDWYANREVGRFLREQLFAPGTSLSPEDVAERLGFGRTLDFAAAAARAQRLVSEADALSMAQ